jgi:hypothetical protein
MSEHRFVVIVNVDDWTASDRDEADYALAALNTAGLPDAKQLDGYADLEAQADIVFVAGDE